MKKHGKTWWLSLTIAALLPLWLIVGTVKFVVWAAVTSPRKAQAARMVIMQADPQALLEACREMIAKREQYRNDWVASIGSTYGDRALQRDRGGYGKEVPQIIRGMDPLHIVVSKQQVFVFVYGPPRTGFIGYDKEMEKLPLVDTNELTMLTNGLWMFTR